MGLETLLILFGIIGQAASDSGTKLHHVAHVCLSIGIIMLVAELLVCWVLWMLDEPR